MSEEIINWGMVTIIAAIIILIGIYKLAKKSKKMGKLGMNTNNLVLMSNLKNILNSMPEEKEAIFKTLFHRIIMATDTAEEISALEEAISKLSEFHED